MIWTYNYLIKEQKRRQLEEFEKELLHIYDNSVEGEFINPEFAWDYAGVSHINPKAICSATLIVLRKKFNELHKEKKTTLHKHCCLGKGWELNDPRVTQLIDFLELNTGGACSAWTDCYITAEDDLICLNYLSGMTVSKQINKKRSKTREYLTKKRKMEKVSKDLDQMLLTDMVGHRAVDTVEETVLEREIRESNEPIKDPTWIPLDTDNTTEMGAPSHGDNVEIEASTSYVGLDKPVNQYNDDDFVFVE